MSSGTIRCLTAVAAALASGVASAQVPCRYDVTVLPNVNCPFGTGPLPAQAMSNTGIVVGEFISCSGNGEDSAWWNGGPNLHILPRPQGVNAVVARDVSDNGIVVGYAGFGTKYKGFLYSISTGQYTFIEPLAPNGWSSVNGISPSGQTVCGYRSSIPPSVGGITQGFIMYIESGLITDIGTYEGASTSLADVIDSETAIGSTVGNPFVWSKGKFTLLPTLAGLESYPRRLNESLQFVGWSALPQSKWPFQGNHACMWHCGRITDLGVLPGDNRSSAAGINSTGMVVGQSRYLTQSVLINHGIIWYESEMQNLTQLIDASLGLVVDWAEGITDDRRIIAGAYSKTTGPRTVLLTPRPLAPGDIDANCRVDIDDLLSVINHWGELNSSADLNGDGIVNFDDLLIVILNWTAN